MALPVPDPEDLDDFSQGETATFSDDQKETALVQASDLLFFATGYDENPCDSPRLQRFIKYALMDMAWSLLVQTANKTEIYSPFSSERIGSYSYSKAARQASTGQATGVDWFDRLVDYLSANGMTSGASSVWHYSEDLFRQPFSAYDAIPVSSDFPDFFGR